MKALKEIHRVLKPTACFGMIWNIEDCEFTIINLSTTSSSLSDNAPKSWEMSTSWEKTVRDLTWTFDDSLPRFRHERWREVFDDQLKSTPFSISAADPLFSLPIGEGSVKFETWLSKDDVWKRYRTLSQIAVLEGEELETVKKAFWKALDGEEVQTDKQGRVAVHGNTFFAWTTRIPGEPLRSGG